VWALLLGAAAGPLSATGIDDARMFDWKKQTPSEFLDVLREQAKQPDLIGTFASVEVPHDGWVKEEHLSGLVALVDSKQRCAHIVTPHAKRLPEALSFVGQEALVMIQAFRDGTYPPRGLTTSEGFYSRKAEILAWWTSRPQP
jgi:hypothetical protein